MIKSYVEIYKSADSEKRLEIIKHFLDKMFPQFDFSPINNYHIIFCRDKYQFYIDKEYVATLRCDDTAVADLDIEVEKSDSVRLRCYDRVLNEIIYDLLEIEQAHW